MTDKGTKTIDSASVYWKEFSPDTSSDTAEADRKPGVKDKKCERAAKEIACGGEGKARERERESRGGGMETGKSPNTFSLWRLQPL